MTQSEETSLHYLSAIDIGSKIRRGEASSVDVTEHLLKRIERFDGELKSFIRVMFEGALRDAERADEEVQNGVLRSPLQGVPIALKDLFFIKGEITACGTKTLSDFVPDYDATVVEKLRESGAVIIGKTRMTEGAFGAHHPTSQLPINPWNRDIWTGVSSSGSAVATAAGLCFGTFGTDTGGSIRTPSACNGLVGVKPTYGRVSRYGVFPIAPSIDHVGPMARTVRDAAVLLQVVSGFDSNDSTSARETVPTFSEDWVPRLNGIRIGFDEKYCSEDVDAETQNVIREGLVLAKSLGAEIVEVRFPDYMAVLRQWKSFVGFEALEVHKEYYPRRKEDYGPVFQNLLQTGEKLTRPEYEAAIQRAKAFMTDLGFILRGVDCMVCPSLPFASPKAQLTEKRILDPMSDGVKRQKFSVPFNFSGNPTISLPWDLSKEGAPMGLQFIGKHFDEKLLFRVGYAMEVAGKWKNRHPGRVF